MFCFMKGMQSHEKWETKNKLKNLTFEKDDTNLEVPKVSQGLLGFRIQKSVPDLMLCLKFMVFILFCKVTSGGKNAGLFQKVM